jgi:steroid delta-isomerase-like uncharacterized protein
MTRDAIVSLLAQRQAAIQRRDVEALMALHSATCVVDSPFGGHVKGSEAIRRVYEGWLEAFPDVDWATEPPIIDGDRVAQVVTVAGTDIGGFMGLPPSGKKFTVPMVHLFTIRDGHIEEERRIYDFTGLLIQLGVLKAKPA